MTKIRQIVPYPLFPLRRWTLDVERWTLDVGRSLSKSQMKLLLTNDDGIDAEGLEALRDAAQMLGDPIIVAPAGPQSGVSHRVTWQEGVRIEPRGEKRD